MRGIGISHSIATYANVPEAFQFILVIVQFRFLCLSLSTNFDITSSMPTDKNLHDMGNGQPNDLRKSHLWKLYRWLLIELLRDLTVVDKTSIFGTNKGDIFCAVRLVRLVYFNATVFVLCPFSKPSRRGRNFQHEAKSCLNRFLHTTLTTIYREHL